MMKKIINQILKFGVVGGIAFVIDYGLLFILTEIFHIHYLLSGTISFSVSVIFNYVLSVLWVFDIKKKRDTKKEFVMFLVLSVIGLGVNQLIMWVLVDKMALYYMLAKIVATVVVMVYNFITRKIFLENTE